MPRGFAGLVLVAVTAFCISTPKAAETTHASVEAVWKPQRLSFQYRGYTMLYTCSGLHRKLRSILTGLGARDTIQLRGYACDDLMNSARFEIALEAPVVATAENVSALTTYSAEQQLIARTRGETLPGEADLERFPASWRTVSFARNRAMRLEPSDCELVQQLRRAVLPLLSVQIVSDHVHCSPFGNTGAPPLTVRALIADPPTS